MQSVKATVPRGTRPMPSRTPEFRAIDAAAYDAMAAARPRKPPPFVFAPRRLTGQLEAKRELARAGGTLAMPRERDDGEPNDGTHIVVI